MAIPEHYEHLAKIFGIIGNFISATVFLAPMSTFYRIVKNKSTDNFRSLPYLVALFSCTLWLYYALLVKKGTMVLVTINSVGFFIETFYVIIFILYANRDAKILTVKYFLALNVATLITIIVTIQFTLHEHSLRVKVLGWICVCFAVGVFAAPHSNLVEVVRTQSAEFISIHLSVALTGVVVWFLYGFFLRDIHIAIPNVLGFVLGLFQIILYIIYRDGAKRMEVLEEEGRIETVVEIPLGNTTFQQEREGAEEEKDISRAKEEEEPTIESIIVPVNTTQEGHQVPVNTEEEIQEIQEVKN